MDVSVTLLHKVGGRNFVLLGIDYERVKANENARKMSSKIAEKPR